MSFILRLITWWNSQTLGTQLFTWRNGVRVGEDEAGNAFYQTRDGKRRWVIYNGEAEASRVSPDWHGWLQRPADPGRADAQALGEAASGKPHRHGGGLCPAGLDPPRRAGRPARLRGMAAGITRCLKAQPRC